MDNTKRNQTFISAVIYVHNSGAEIEALFQAVRTVLQENFEHSEIICVNDASSDNGMEHIKRIGREPGTSSITVLNMSCFHGLEMAMNAGVDLCIGDFVFEFDSTHLDFDPSEIIRVYQKALEGYDIVSASPDQKEKLSSRLFYTVFERFAALPFRMATERFRILSRRALNRISSMNKMIPYRKAAYANCGLKMDNLRYNAKNINCVHSDKAEKKYKIGLAMDMLILFTEIGWRFSIFMTVCMMFLSVFMTGYSVTVYATAHPVAGWTTTILFLSAAFGGLFAILAIIIKYLQLLVDLGFKRRHYSFESIEKLTGGK